MKVQSIVQSTITNKATYLIHINQLTKKSAKKNTLNEEGYNMNLIGEDDEPPEGLDGDEMYY